MGGNENFLDIGYGIQDMGYRIWFVGKVEGTKNLTESEAPTIIYTIKCTYFMQGACYIQK